MPSRLKKAILRFMREMHAKQDLSYDCYSFACEANGVDVSEGKEYLQKIWNLRTPKRRKEPGDTIFLTGTANGEMHFRHAAVYLGHKLYISVWGAGGDLEIATLPDMIRCYGSTGIALAVPRNAID